MTASRKIFFKLKYVNDDLKALEQGLVDWITSVEGIATRLYGQAPKGSLERRAQVLLEELHL